MTTTTPRRAVTCNDQEATIGRLLLHHYCEDGLHACPNSAHLPRRSRPQRAVHCLATNFCFGCPGDEHRRTGPEFEEQPRRAVSLTDWAVPERWAS